MDAKLLADYGLVAIAVPAFAMFLLKFMEGLRKFRSKRIEQRDSGKGRLVCLYPGREHYDSTVREVRSMYEDSLRRSVRDEQVSKVLEKIADNIQTQTQIQRSQADALIEIKNDYKDLTQKVRIVN